MRLSVSPLPNNKILEGTRLKAFADGKLNVARMTISLYDRVENTVGKGENAGLPAFSPFPTVFSKAFFFGVVQSRGWVVRSSPYSKQQILDLSKLNTVADKKFSATCNLKFVFTWGKKHC